MYVCMYVCMYLVTITYVRKTKLLSSIKACEKNESIDNGRSDILTGFENILQRLAGAHHGWMIIYSMGAQWMDIMFRHL